jgi:glc operon protein GlcG
MKRLAISSLGAAVLGVALLWASTGFGGAAAQSAASNAAASASPLDAIPPKLPFNVPYGPPISLQRAQALLQAAIAEATRRGWPLNVAVVDSGGNLVAFARMDGAMLASIKIAEHKARVAVTYRRPTRVFEDAIQKQNSIYVLTLDDIIASRGGIPLIENGKLIGAIGCSGGAGSQDEAVCTAAAATINR